MMIFLKINPKISFFPAASNSFFSIRYVLRAARFFARSLLEGGLAAQQASLEI
jgi:hypothetical protein